MCGNACQSASGINLKRCAKDTFSCSAIPPSTILLEAALPIAKPELAERGRRCIERYLADTRLAHGKILDSFDFDTVLMISKAQVMATTAGDLKMCEQEVTY